MNPKIVRSTGDDRDLEGCLSIPGYVAYVTRRERVWVVAQDRQGRKIKVAGSGSARAGAPARAGPPRRQALHRLPRLHGRVDGRRRRRRGRRGGPRGDERPGVTSGPGPRRVASASGTDRLPGKRRVRDREPAPAWPHHRGRARRGRHGPAPTSGSRADADPHARSTTLADDAARPGHPDPDPSPRTGVRGGGPRARTDTARAGRLRPDRAGGAAGPAAWRAQPAPIAAARDTVAPRRSRRPSSPATPRPASPSCAWTRASTRDRSSRRSDCR